MILSGWGDTNRKPEVHSYRKPPSRVNIFNALANEAAVDWFVRCHFADRGILCINNDAKLRIVSY